MWQGEVWIPLFDSNTIAMSVYNHVDSLSGHLSINNLATWCIVWHKCHFFKLNFAQQVLVTSCPTSRQIWMMTAYWGHTHAWMIFTAPGWGIWKQFNIRLYSLSIGQSMFYLEIWQIWVITTYSGGHCHGWRISPTWVGIWKIKLFFTQQVLFTQYSTSRIS